MTHWEIHSDTVAVKRKWFDTREKASAVAELLAEDNPGATVWVHKVEPVEHWQESKRVERTVFDNGGAE